MLYSNNNFNSNQTIVCDLTYILFFFIFNILEIHILDLYEYISYIYLLICINMYTSNFYIKIKKIHHLYYQIRK